MILLRLDQVLKKKQKNNNPGCSEEEQFIGAPFKVKELIGFRNHGANCWKLESSSFFHDAGTVDSAPPKPLPVGPPATGGVVVGLVC